MINAERKKNKKTTIESVNRRLKQVFVFYSVTVKHLSSVVCPDSDHE